MLSARPFALALVALSAVACAPEAAELPAEEAADDARAIAAGTHFVVTRQDYRKCISPMCGGVYVQAVNRSTTTCLDGTKQTECYVGELDLAALGLGEEQAQDLRTRAISGQVIFTGSLQLLQGDIAKLTAVEARTSVDDEGAFGTHYFVAPSGIQCVTTPCNALRARGLNTTTNKTFAELDLSGVGLDEAATAALHEAVFAGGLVVSGTIKTKNGTRTLHANQAYTQVVPDRVLCLADDACGKGQYCDHTECLSNCPPDMMCPAVCYGVCTEGEPPPPAGASCVDRCGGPSTDESCWCDDQCEYYGDCCADHAATCG